MTEPARFNFAACGNFVATTWYRSTIFRAVVIEIGRVEIFALRLARRSGECRVADLMPVEQVGDRFEVCAAVAQVQRLGGAVNDGQADLR